MEDQNNEVMLNIEQNLSTWLSGLIKIESLAYDLNNQATELYEEECNSKKSFLQALQENFNYDRNDLRTFSTIQRDFAAETYIKQLENTLEVVMSKYRKLAQNQIKTSCDEARAHLKQKSESGDTCRNSVAQNTINALIKMMDEFLLDGNNLTNSLLEENMFLKTENDTLRKIVQAYEKFGVKEDDNNNTNI